jgi:hypothetical protein
MKKPVVFLLGLILVAAACGDDDASDPAGLDSCEAVADSTVDLVQDVIDELEAMSPSDVGALTQGQEFPAFVEIEARGEALGLRGQELECTDIDALFLERADRLTADPENGFTQLILEGAQSGEDVMARLFR